MSRVVLGVSLAALAAGCVDLDEAETSSWSSAITWHYCAGGGETTTGVFAHGDYDGDHVDDYLAGSSEGLRLFGYTDDLVRWNRPVSPLPASGPRWKAADLDGDGRAEPLVLTTIDGTGDLVHGRYDLAAQDFVWRRIPTPPGARALVIGAFRGGRRDQLMTAGAGQLWIGDLHPDGAFDWTSLGAFSILDLDLAVAVRPTATGPFGVLRSPGPNLELGMLAGGAMTWRVVAPRPNLWGHERIGERDEYGDVLVVDADADGDSDLYWSHAIRIGPEMGAYDWTSDVNLMTFESTGLLSSPMPAALASASTGNVFLFGFRTVGALFQFGHGGLLTATHGGSGYYLPFYKAPGERRLARHTSPALGSTRTDFYGRVFITTLRGGVSQEVMSTDPFGLDHGSEYGGFDTAVRPFNYVALGPTGTCNTWGARWAQHAILTDDARNSAPAILGTPQTGMTVFMRGAGGDLWTATSTPAGGLTPPTQVAGVPAGTFLSSVTASGEGHNATVIGRGPGGQIARVQVTSGVGSPPTFYPGPPGGATGTPAIVGQSQYIFVRGGDNKLWETTSGDGWVWSRITASEVADSAPAVRITETDVSIGRGKLHVYYRTATDTLAQGVWDRNVMSWPPPTPWLSDVIDYAGAAVTSAPSLIVRADDPDTIEVFFTGPFGRAVCHRTISARVAGAARCFAVDAMTGADPVGFDLGHDAEPGVPAHRQWKRFGVVTTTPLTPNGVLARNDGQPAMLELTVLRRAPQFTVEHNDAVLEPVAVGSTKAVLHTEVAGDTTGAAAAMQASCAPSAAPEVGHALTIERRSRVELATAGSAFDTVLYVTRGGQPGAQLACNDDAGGTLTSAVDVVLDPGIYDVVVDGYGGASGAYALTAAVTVLPDTNDRLQSARIIAGSQVARGTTLGLADDRTPSCARSAGGADAYYRVELAGPARLRLDTAGSQLDTALAVLDAAGNELACNDDASAPSSAIDAWLGPGTFDVLVDGATAREVGPYALAVQIDPQARPDGFATAFDLGRGGIATGSTTQLGDHAGPPCAASSAGDAVYVVTLTEREALDLSTLGSQYDTVLHVQRASDHASVGCNDDTGGGLTSALQLTLDPGTYFVIVDGYGAARGAYRLHVSRSAT